MPPRCKHCDVEMLAWQPPPEAAWDAPYLFVCFNDECPHFQRSSVWMKTQYSVSVMYRFRIDPRSGNTGSIPVWSREALRDGTLTSEQLAQLETES
jgi:hypothetical protein